MPADESALQSCFPRIGPHWRTTGRQTDVSALANVGISLSAVERRIGGRTCTQLRPCVSCQFRDGKTLLAGRGSEYSFLRHGTPEPR